MPILGNTINGVHVRFDSTVNRDVAARLIEALRGVIRADIAEGHVLSEIYIESVSDQHDSPRSPAKRDGKSVSIARINGLKMSAHYLSNPSVKAIVDAIQIAFEKYPHRSENFGPGIKKRLGTPIVIPGHRDHVRLSVH